MARVSIVGLGLIGGSIGLALRQWMTTPDGRKNSFELIGYDKDGEKANMAARMGVVATVSRDFGGAVRNADMVIICTPALAVREVLTALAPVVSSGAVVTDTTSTKQQVLQWADELLPNNIHFVGGHPMAGGTGGLGDARNNLFTGATYAICPSMRASETAIEQVIMLVRMVGASPLFIDPLEHDAAVAAVSHMPFTLAATLAKVTMDSDGWSEMGKLAATAYREMTRLAEGDPIMHRDILLSNKQAVVSWLDRYVALLFDMRELIKSADPNNPNSEAAKRIEQFFTAARDEREKWLNERSGGNRALESELQNINMGNVLSRGILGGFGRKPQGK
ncbi:MAG: prephenate dehydrogenase/arogenate dehydrogenase family protein [Candidatus Chloroheliales bacterium]|nr:MAG: prephenate dehydrogenase/arogenate dehydrogenase family protein [Chloroflexota bacterium]